MPAPFTQSLCGYRATNGNPNTSDNNDDLSKKLGIALFERLGIVSGTKGAGDPGRVMEREVAEHLATIRPDLFIAQSRHASSFSQYVHLAVFREFGRKHKDGQVSLLHLQAQIGELQNTTERQRLEGVVKRVLTTTRTQDELVAQLKAQMPEESLLKIDIAVAERDADPACRLHIALTSKWSLRTDRAQDCISQGSKLVSLRRGRMPHFAVVTMEPRPSMLKILGDGSGAIDCVYHLDLPALTDAIDDVAKAGRGGVWSPRTTFRRLVGQGRLRDYDDLVDEIRKQPYAPRTDGPRR